MVIGKKKWIIPGGNMPLKSTGKEPEMLSQDRISILNTNKKDVQVKVQVFYEKEESVTGYQINIKGQRLRCIRINDLIDPFPIELEKPYSLLIEAEDPILVQFLKMNTSSAEVSIMGTMAFATN
jgi:hypothetical protein